MDYLAHAGGISVVEIDNAGRLVIAAILGMCMGWERSMAGKHAGMRTYAMVSLGSALLVVMGTLASFELQMFAGINPLQLAGSIIIGIGFIGSGLAAYRVQHAELTTASGIWVVAGVGMACGFGFYILAGTATLLSVIIFGVFSKVERTLRSKYGVDGK